MKKKTTIHVTYDTDMRLWYITIEKSPTIVLTKEELEYLGWTIGIALDASSREEKKDLENKRV